MKLYIGFSKPKSCIFPIFSWLVRLIEQTKYSHVYIRWHSIGADVEVAYHASGSMVHFLSKKHFDTDVEVLEEYEVEIDRSTYKKLLHFCMTNAGTSYGVKQIIGIAVQRLFWLKKNPFSDGKSSQICSELVGYVINDILGKNVSIDYDSDGPRKINELVKKNFKRTR